MPPSSGVTSSSRSPSRLSPIESVLTPEQIRAKIEQVEQEIMTKELERCNRQRQQRRRELKKLQRDQEQHFSHFHRLSRLPDLDPGAFKKVSLISDASPAV
jgi:hypothetical protein